MATRSKAIRLVPARRSAGNAYQVFLDALSNLNTRTNYVYFFSQFREALKLSESCNELLEMDSRELEDKIVEYIKQMTTKRGASSAAVKITLTSIRKFYIENRQESRLNWSWLRNRIPKGNGTVKDRDYTKEELVKMWEQSDIRKKAILALFMTGVRKGGVPDLRVGSLEKITRYKDKDEKQHDLEHHIYKVNIYEGSDEEYYSFLTPSGAKAIDRYLEARTAAGEKVTANSPLVRDVFDSAKKNADQPKPVTLDALDMLFMRLTRSVGIRPKKKEGKRRQDRHELMLFHGIRKYVNHALVNSGVDVIAKELLIGHSPPGLEGSYLRLTEAELLRQFLKAVPALSLSQEHELREQVDQLRIEVADIDVLKVAYNELKQQKEQDEGYIAHLQEAWEEHQKRQAEERKQLADAIRQSQQAVAELRATMEEKLREREKREKKNRGRG